MESLPHFILIAAATTAYPEAGKKVDKENLTQFGRAMRQLGIEMIPAYSPEAEDALSVPFVPIRIGL